ncbi:hypothetical protein H312_01379 [Anncaliia algerae PRA339]|uniref:Transposase IS30-like HTH domain-containing protein n=1 Tax=Anncaliia algerae PRA339 TaxID=1288291 RepID=A0A059F2F5_9MICR|nr:hypothetical protein H312_01379 [Anncaliia algerae PRA339]
MGSHLSVQKKVEIITWSRSGKSVREIANITSVPRSTVSRILVNEKRNKSLHRKSGSGRPSLNIDKLKII